MAESKARNTDPRYSKLTIGVCPDQWGVWFPQDEKQIDWDVALDEMATAGFSVMETGPFGYFPTESSEHSAEYVPWFLHHDDLIDRYRIEVDEYLRRSEENLAEWEAIKRALDAGEDLEVDRTDELASQFVRALETGAEAELYGNVRNDGSIYGLPDDACIEVPMRVGRDGVQPARFGAIPPQCLALNRTFLNVVELTVRAVVEGSRELVYQAALVDPNTAATLTVEAIVEMVDELIDTHGELIPEPIRRG